MEKYSEVNIYRIFHFIIWLTCDLLLLSFFAGIEIFETSIHLLQPWLVKKLDLIVVFVDHLNGSYMQESCSNMIFL